MPRPSDICRLYLVLPSAVTPRMEADLSQALHSVDLACLLLSGDPRDMDEDLLRRMMHCTQTREIAFLLQDDAETAKRLGADGVHLGGGVDTYRKARELLGKGAIVGAGYGGSRHEAMMLADDGADYVAFGNAEDASDEKRAELIGWWSELFQVPGIAWNVETIDAAASLAEAGADFVALSPSIWDAECPVEVIRAAEAALAAASGPA